MVVCPAINEAKTNEKTENIAINPSRPLSKNSCDY